METKHVILLNSRCTRFEVHSFMRRTNTSLGWCAKPAQRGGFVFPLLPACFCRAVQAEFCPSSPVCPFRPVCTPVVCFSLYLERDCEFEGEHIGRRVSTVPGSDLESIPCLGNSLTKSEQSLLGDQHDARIVAKDPRDQEICVCRVSCGKNTLLVFLSAFAHIFILVPAVASPGCTDRSCHDISWLYCLSYRIISTSVRLNNSPVSKSRKDSVKSDPRVC